MRQLWKATIQNGKTCLSGIDSVSSRYIEVSETSAGSGQASAEKAESAAEARSTLWGLRALDAQPPPYTISGYL